MLADDLSLVPIVELRADFRPEQWASVPTSLCVGVGQGLVRCGTEYGGMEPIPPRRLC